MSKVVVQVPMDKKTRDEATKVAEDYGLSSLQEAFRIFAKKLASRRITVDISEVEYLAPEEDKLLTEKYRKFLKEKKAGKTYEARSTREMMEQLAS